MATSSLALSMTLPSPYFLETSIKTLNWLVNHLLGSLPTPCLILTETHGLSPRFL